jgi:hypothetical protein
VNLDVAAAHDLVAKANAMWWRSPKPIQIQVRSAVRPEEWFCCNGALVMGWLAYERLTWQVEGPRTSHKNLEPDVDFPRDCPPCP